MDSPKGKISKKGLISKTWERCKSFSGGIGRKGTSSLGPLKIPMIKSKSWPRGLKSVESTRDDHDQEKTSGKIIRSRSQVAPEGCFSVYVGPDKQRFVIKTEYVNHPLFKTLLEEAEMEYGYSSEGPLVLPCEVDHFVKVLMEMDYYEEIHGKHYRGRRTRSHSDYHLLMTPQRLVVFN